MQGILRTRLALAALALAALGALLAIGQPGGERAGAATATKAGKGQYSIKTKSFQISAPNDGQRLTVSCPGKSEPLGGGLITEPPDADGEGIYPHSYERLGRQSGYHVSVILYDPSPGQTKSRSVQLQVVCGPKFGKVSPPHAILNLGGGDDKQATAKCPGRRYLIGGGYQRTNFTNQGGIIATESRASSPKHWTVHAHGLGKFGGQAVAIGYCVRAGKPPLKEVSATTQVPPGQYATVQTPACPKKRLLAFGGFRAPPDGSVLPTGGSFQNGAWLLGGYNTGSQPGELTAYGYCLKV